MKKHFIHFWLLLSLGTATIVFNSCSEDESYGENRSRGKNVTDISLNRTILTLVVGEEGALTATLLPLGIVKTVTWINSDETKVTISNGKVTAIAVGTTTITAKVDNKTATVEVTVIDSSAVIDEGVIINGVKWATRNVATPGHFVEKPEDPGMCYQWNRNTGWNAIGTLVNSNGGTLKDWDSSISTGTTWEVTNDVCPAGWRLPTIEEIQSLKDANSTFIGNHLDGNPANGVVFGSGNNTIFLPAAGFRYDGNVNLLIGMGGYYWSSEPYDEGYYHNGILHIIRTHAYLLYFSFTHGFGYTVNNYAYSREYACSVRCVAE